jgi:hypothetical protein
MEGLKPEQYLKQLKMPDLCARCGDRARGGVWPIYSRYNFSFRLARTTYKKSRFYVPVCNSCKAHLENDNSFWLRVSWVTGIGFFALLVLAILMYTYSLVFFLLSVLALIGFIGAYLKRSKYWGNSGIASYDGKHFSFNNREFQKKFKELNPSMIREN